MELQKNIFKNILLAILFLALFLPLIQSKFEFKTLEPLKGALVDPEDVSFSKGGWVSSDFQEKKEVYLNSMFGFRSFFIRINNQIAYSFFNKAKANGVIIGKENYLFEEKYLTAFGGKDFIGEDSINKNIEKIKFINDTLLKLNKQIVIILASGKASYFPEFIPNSYLPFSEKTNYKVLSNKLANTKLFCIDFNKWTMDNKLKSKYPLYPKHGIHWSTYASSYAADSIVKYIEKIRSIDMPNYKLSNIKFEEPKNLDYDIANGMNLLFKLNGYNVAYPEINIENSDGKVQPSVLVVSDSFYWEMYVSGITNCFKNSNFWYYNKQVWPESASKEVNASELSVNTEIDKHDVFVVMATEANLNNLGWGFIERVYDHFKGIRNFQLKSPEYLLKLKTMIDLIKSNPEWMNNISLRAPEKGISPDSLLTLDAIWQIDHPTK